jgi:type II secretory pathway pseudopilin PulG
MTLLETLVSMALSVAVSGAVLSLVAAGQTIARTQPEISDLQQRARVALQTLGRELRDAGAGMDRGALAGTLARYFPPVTPSADGGITIWKTTNRYAQAAVRTAAQPGATAVALDDNPGCPTGAAACAFAPDANAIAFTPAGCRTTVRLAGTAGDVLQLASPLVDCALDPGAGIAEGSVRTYRVDGAARQLIRRDEATGSSAPVLDGVAAMTVTYYGDAAGTIVIGGTDDAELRRVRRVRVTLRFAAMNPLLRIPDLTVGVDAAPRNLEGG